MKKLHNDQQREAWARFCMRLTLELRKNVPVKWDAGRGKFYRVAG